MTKPSTGLMILVMTVFIIFSAGIAGCSSPAPSPQIPGTSPIPTQKLSTVEPAALALQPADFPGNFSFVEKGERNVSEMRNWSLDHGWKKGYYTVYQKIDRNVLSGKDLDEYCFKSGYCNPCRKF